MNQPHPPSDHPAFRRGPGPGMPPGGYPRGWQTEGAAAGPYTRPENRQPPPRQPHPYIPAQRQPFPPQMAPVPLVAPVAPARNGLGLAAVVIAPVGVLFGLVPLTGFVAVVCGLVAVPLAAAGYVRYRNGHATNGRTAITGLVIGLLALALGIWGITIVANTLDELAGPQPVGVGTGNAPAGTGQAGAGQAGAAAATTAFGGRVTFDDGVAVEVSAPQPFQPSGTAVGNDRDRAVSAEVTLVNNSEQPLDAVLVMVRAAHDGRTAPQIFDSANGFGGAVMGTVLPGRSMTFPVAFSVGRDPGELQVEVDPSFLGAPAIFTGQA